MRGILTAMMLLGLCQAAFWGWVAMTHPYVDIVGAIAIAIAPAALVAVIAATKLVAIYKERR
jgi:uncharacterized membrane protein